MGTIKNTFRRFSRSERGNIGIVFGAAATALVSANLFAVEYSRAVTVKAEVQRNLDATLIHLARTEARLDPQVPGEAFLRAAVANSNVDLDSFDPQFTWNEETAELNAVVNFSPELVVAEDLLPEIMMQVAAAATPLFDGDIELALVLDSSGSMLYSINDANGDTPVAAPNRRIDALQSAVSRMLDVIEETSNNEASIAVIPYASSVDISDLYVRGETHEFRAVEGRTEEDLQLNLVDETAIQRVSYGNAGMLRKKGIWAAERFQSHNDDGFRLYRRNPNGSENTAVPITSQRFMGTFCNSVYVNLFNSFCVPAARRFIGDSYFYKGHFHPHIGVLPQTTNTQEVRDFLAKIDPYGGTAGHLGAAWGLYALNRNWHGVFEHPAGQPEKWSEGSKHLVIMTDGQFNSPQTPGITQDDIFDYFQEICDHAARVGISVYTVGLLVEDQRMDEVLGDCVTSPNAFRNIGRATTEARISG